MIKHALRTLFIGGRDGFSLGRTAFWLTFSMLFYKWWHEPGIDPSLVTVFVTIMGYTLGGKIVAKWDGSKSHVELEDKPSKKDAL
jgi:hypothetical protein